MASFLLDASYALAEPITAVQFTTGGSEATSNETRGFDFSLSGPITITALGWYDSIQDGLNASHEIGVWDSTGALLLRGTVDSGTTDPLSGLFRYTSSLSGSLTLAAGSYVIGGLTDLSDRNLREIPMADVTFASGLTFGGSVTNDVIGTFSEPTTQTPNLDVGYFGPNFQFTAAVAEPSTWAMMLLGFAGLWFAARRRWGAAVRLSHKLDHVTLLP